MDAQRRRALADEALRGYPHGMAAVADAGRDPLSRLDDPAAVLVVEGVSDQIAVETLAAVSGLDLTAVRAAVVPVGGAHALARAARAIATRWPTAWVGGLCDAAEEAIVRAGLARAGLGSAADRAELDRLGYFVCDPDLEDELVRALGAHETVRCIDAQGDLASLQSLQRQPAWRDRTLEDQLRRFLGSGARRKLRYARLLTSAIAPERMPGPLVAAVDALREPSHPSPPASLDPGN